MSSKQQLAVAQDHAEEVVEVVGDTSRQLADRFHLVGLPQPLFRGAKGPPLPRLAQAAHDGRTQARESPLDDEVVGARFHRLDRLLLADRPRHDDEWDVYRRLMAKGQRFRSAELRHLEVGNNDVPLASLEGFEHRLPGLHPFGGHVVFEPPELDQEELGIVLPVLEDQHAEIKHSVQLRAG